VLDGLPRRGPATSSWPTGARPACQSRQRTGRLQTITASRLSIRLGRLSDDDMASVDQELKDVLGL
jgi:hypothetical protein